MTDDLEERLGRLSPADPSRDLMRRLRAAEPPLSAGQRLRRWLAPGSVESFSLRLAACGGLLLAAAIWIVVASVGRFSTGAGEGSSNRVSPALTARSKVTASPAVSVPEDSIPPRGAAQNGGTPLNPDRSPGFDRRDSLALGYSALSDRLRNRSDDPLRLETATGPVRLECGYTLPGSHSDGDLFGNFNLNVSD